MSSILEGGGWSFVITCVRWSYVRFLKWMKTTILTCSTLSFSYKTTRFYRPFLLFLFALKKNVIFLSAFSMKMKGLRRRYLFNTFDSILLFISFYSINRFRKRDKKMFFSWNLFYFSFVLFLSQVFRLLSDLKCKTSVDIFWYFF